MVEMMSRLGQCVSNHTIKEIENEMTIEATKSVKAIPFRMSLNGSAAWCCLGRIRQVKMKISIILDEVCSTNP